jgi:AcrR family transcriptional regulator
LGIEERKQREKESRRQQILQAAREITMLKGVKSATMEEIANRAELSPGTIYRYFEDKDHLQVSLGLEGLQDVVKRITKVHENKKLSVEDKIYGFRDALYETYRSDPRLFADILQFQLAADFGSLNRELLNSNNELYGKLLVMFASTYEEGVRQGKFKDGHKMAYADIIFGTFIGLMLLEDAKNKVNPQKDFLRDTLDKAFDVLIEGIKRKG